MDDLKNFCCMNDSTTSKRRGDLNGECKYRLFPANSLHFHFVVRVVTSKSCVTNHVSVMSYVDSSVLGALRAVLRTLNFCRFLCQLSGLTKRSYEGRLKVFRQEFLFGP